MCVIVVTPSLNKSFKFDSVWPENSSQAYLLQNLVEDVKGDSKASLEKTDNGYIIKSTVNYPNNEDLSYQKIYFDDKMNINKVEVYNSEDIVKIKVTFKSVDLKAKLDEDDFLLDDLIDTEINNEENNTEGECNEGTCEDKTSATLDSIIYPLYIPSNTHLSSSENIETETGERVILTFSGEKNFVIVEEVASASNEFEVIPVFGDPLMLNESVGALSSNSISWHANNISYYLVSSDLSTNELISVAKSLGNASTVISTK